MTSVIQNRMAPQIVTEIIDGQRYTIKRAGTKGQLKFYNSAGKEVPNPKTAKKKQVEKIEIMASANKSMMQNFRDKARSFNLKYTRLQAMQNDVRKYPALNIEYQKLMGDGATIRNTIRRVTGGIDNVVGWFNNIFGRDTQLKGMGLLPLIPVAVVIASLAGMGKWASDVYMFERRFEEIKRLERAGLSPEKASDLVSEKEPTGIIAGMTREIMVPMTVAGVVLIAGWFLLKNGKT